MQSESRSWVTNGCWRFFCAIHSLLRAIREAWAKFESHRGSSYDHLATSRPRLRKAHQQAHGGRCLTSSSRPASCWVFGSNMSLFPYHTLRNINMFFHENFVKCCLNASNQSYIGQILFLIRNFPVKKTKYSEPVLWTWQFLILRATDTFKLVPKQYPALVPSPFMTLNVEGVKSYLLKGTYLSVKLHETFSAIAYLHWQPQHLIHISDTDPFI